MAEFDFMLASRVLSYDAESGAFTWVGLPSKKASSRIRVGDVAGVVRGDGYVRLKLAQVPILAHRLAWWFFYGKEPAGVIDHINGVPGDNRISNLRDVSQAINNENRRGLSLGVQTRGARHYARIKASGKTLYLGAFDSVSDAHRAYVSAKRELHAGNTL